MKLSSLVFKISLILMCASSLTACKSTDINSLLDHAINSDLRTVQNKNRKHLFCMNIEQPIIFSHKIINKNHVRNQKLVHKN